ncbi:MAG: NfeD family protein [Halobacteriovoraceae bacterium]|jgi:inner membrane protein|nr:NfeD family protein [Halobacteriovoraceae bacterium]
MNDLAFNIWLGFGIFCVVSEFLLPGLVMVFVGLGSLTVALGMHLGHIDGLPQQFITFFVSSLIYLLTLRFLILRFVPTSTRKADVDEDHDVIGSEVEVVEDITAGKFGRISHSDSTWQAKSEGDVTILKGEKAKIIGRDNITWIVKKI